jgi:hypothetical protein
MSLRSRTLATRRPWRSWTPGTSLNEVVMETAPSRTAASRESQAKAVRAVACWDAEGARVVAAVSGAATAEPESRNRAIARALGWVMSGSFGTGSGRGDRVGTAVQPLQHDPSDASGQPGPRGIRPSGPVLALWQTTLATQLARASNKSCARGVNTPGDRRKRMASREIRAVEGGGSGNGAGVRRGRTGGMLPRIGPGKRAA